MFFWVAVTWGACFGLWLDRGAQIFLSIRWHASWAQLGLSMSKTLDYSDLVLPVSSSAGVVRSYKAWVVRQHEHRQSDVNLGASYGR